jgi:flagellar hook-basal body complex protein FliE
MEIQSTRVPALTPGGDAATASPAGGVESFGKLLADALGALQQSQSQADLMVSALATDEPVDLHAVMLAVEQANLATQLAVQVRNKLIEAYQEISRMQI